MVCTGLSGGLADVQDCMFWFVGLQGHFGRKLTENSRILKWKESEQRWIISENIWITGGLETGNLWVKEGLEAGKTWVKGTEN